MIKKVDIGKLLRQNFATKIVTKYLEILPIAPPNPTIKIVFNISQIFSKITFLPQSYQSKHFQDEKYLNLIFCTLAKNTKLL